MADINLSPADCKIAQDHFADLSKLDVDARKLAQDAFPERDAIVLCAWCAEENYKSNIVHTVQNELIARSIDSDKFIASRILNGNKDSLSVLKLILHRVVSLKINIFSQ